MSEWRWGAHVREKTVLRLRHSNDDYLAPSAAQVSSSVQLDADLWKFAGEVIDESEDGALPSPRLRCAPEPVRRRQRAQLGTDVTDCRSAARRREKRVYFTFAPLQRRLLGADFRSGQFISAAWWRFVEHFRPSRRRGGRRRRSLCHRPASVARLMLLVDVGEKLHK